VLCVCRVSISIHHQHFWLMASDEAFTQPWDHSDVSFAVEGHHIYANKTILSMWSPVFNAMFSGAFKESDAAVIDLPGKQYNDVLELIRVLHPPNKLLDGRLSLVKVRRLKQACSHSVLAPRLCSPRNLKKPLYYVSFCYHMIPPKSLTYLFEVIFILRFAI